MLRRYWLPLIAVVGLILAAQQSADAQGSQGGTTKPQHAPQTQAQPTVAPALQDSLNRIGSALEAANNKQEPAKNAEQAKQNLEAQVVMARSANRMFYVGLGELIITFIGVMLVLATLIYTKKAADAARASVVIAERSLSELERPVLFPSTVYLTYRMPGQPSIGIILKNYGRSGAVLEEVYSSISITVAENRAARAAEERTSVRNLTEIIGEKEALPEIYISPKPHIGEYAPDIENGKLVLSLYLSISYSSMSGDKYEATVSYDFNPARSDRRFVRRHHAETRNGKYGPRHRQETGDFSPPPYMDVI